MSRASHERFLRKAARGAVIRETRRTSGAPLTLDRVRALKLQTVEPWKRVLALVAGLLLAAAGSIAWVQDVTWLAILLIAAGAILVLIAFFGRKRTMKAVLDSADLGEIASGIADHLIDF